MATDWPDHLKWTMGQIENKHSPRPNKAIMVVDSKSNSNPTYIVSLYLYASISIITSCTLLLIRVTWRPPNSLSESHTLNSQIEWKMGDLLETRKLHWSSSVRINRTHVLWSRKTRSAFSSLEILWATLPTRRICVLVKLLLKMFAQFFRYFSQVTNKLVLISSCSNSKHSEVRRSALVLNFILVNYITMQF